MSNMRIDRLSEPLSITMWDSSWLRRQYDGGGFESFDRALDELVERGYNAVRIDCFPHLIANAPDGSNCERFLDPAGFGFHWYAFAQWGSPWTVYTHPRRDLVKFLKACEKRKVSVLLSTWLKPTAEPRNEWMKGPCDHVRIWDETLRFLEENDCLKQIVGVDVQNEIPWGAVYPWMGEQLKGKTPEEIRNFSRQYYKTVLNELRRRWPQIPIGVSFSGKTAKDAIDSVDPADCDFIDLHFWVSNLGVLDGTQYEDAIMHFGERPLIREKGLDGYLSGQRIAPPDMEFERINAEIHDRWFKNRERCAAWIEECIAQSAELGKEYQIPVGCTEGWGTIFWVQHPLLTWDLIKDAGRIAAEFGQKYGFAFNCQSNFCSPQFVSLWKDIGYHQEISGIIRGKR